MPRMRKSLACCVMAAGLVAAGAARAEDVKQYPECTHEPSETDLTAAKGAFQAGNASFDEADYPRAIVYWEDAYRRDCTAHALLLNLARAYELNGNKPQAIVSLQAYLDRVPATPDKDKIQRRIEVLQKQLDAEKAAAPPAPPAPAPVVTPPAPPAPPPAETKPTGKRPIAPLIVGAAGGGLAAVGIVVFAAGKHDLNVAEDSCPDHFCTNDVDRNAGNAARQRVNAGTALTIAGVVTAGAGLTWYFLQRPHAAKPATSVRRLAPVAAPGFLGLSYGGKF